MLAKTSERCKKSLSLLSSADALTETLNGEICKISSDIKIRQMRSVLSCVKNDNISHNISNNNSDDNNNNKKARSGLRPDLNQKCTPKVCKLTKCPEHEEQLK